MNNLQASFRSRFNRASVGWLCWLLTLAGAGAQVIEFVPGSPTVYEGGTNVAVVVTRSPATGAASVDFTTVDVTATAGQDYVAQAGTLTFADGEVSKLITLDILPDALEESAEQFQVVLSNPVNATLGRDVVTVTIFDDDAMYQFAQAAYSISENGSNLVVTITRSGGSNGPGQVDYLIVDADPTNNPAILGSDYMVSRSGRFVFNTGQTTYQFNIPIIDDTVAETNEVFHIVLTNAVGGSIGIPDRTTVTIMNDDPAGGRIRTAGTMVAMEGTTTNIWFYRVGSAEGAVTVEYSVHYNDWNSCPGTTVPRIDVDYTVSRNGTVSWADGDANPKSISLTTLSDEFAELDENFTLELVRVTAGTAAIDPPYKFLTVTLWSREMPPGANDREYNVAKYTNPNPGANYAVYGIAVYTNAFDTNLNKSIIVGDFSAVNSMVRNGIARMNANGSLDLSFDPGSGANGFVGSVAIQNDGKVLVAGGFSAIDNISRRCIARLNADGSLDTQFNPGSGADGPILAMELQPDGQIIIAGDFTKYNNTPRSHVARLNANGTLDMSFDPGDGPNDSVYAVAVQPDGKVVLGGMFSFVSGEQFSSIARLMTNGQVDLDFMPLVGADDTVYTVKVMPDGKLLIGGAFTAFDGESRNSIAQLNADGTLDITFNPGTGFSGPVYAIALQANAQPIVGGEFATFNQTPRNNVARLYANGTLDTYFMDSYYIQTQPGTDGLVDAVAVQPDGNVLIGGGFQIVGGDEGDDERVYLVRQYNRIHDLTGVAPRYNFARLVGGVPQPTRNTPGNIEFVSAISSVDENAAVNGVYLLVRRLNGSLGRLQVDYTTSDGSAFAGKDYTGTSGRFSWSDCDNAATRQIYIPITDNTTMDGNRTFYVTLANPVSTGNYAIGQPALGFVTRAEVTILDNDASAGSLGFASPVYEVSETVSGRVINITLTRTNGSTGKVNVQYNAADGTAVAGADYTAASGMITFNPGETNKTFPITIINDTAIESEETIQLLLSNPTGGATLGLASATLLLFDGPESGIGSLSFVTNSLVVSESESTATVTIRRTSGSTGKIWATLSSSDLPPGVGAAREGVDYQGHTNMVKFESGVTQQTVTIPILGDDLVEGDEFFNLQLSGVQSEPAGGTIGFYSAATMRIAEDDAYGRLGFGSDRFYISEKDGVAAIKVLRANGQAEEVSVDYTVTAGTATDGLDFITTNGSLVFANGVIEQTILVPIVDDVLLEANETLQITLANFSKASAGTIITTELAIVDDEALSGESGSVDTIFDPIPGPNGPVHAVAAQADGKLVIGGEFTKCDLYGRQRVARLFADGSVDPAFRPGNGANDTIRTLIIQPNEKVLVGGDFTTLGNRNRNYIGRLNQNGAVDNSFNPGAGMDAPVYTLALQPDGRVLAGGAFTTFDSLPANRLVRLLADGTRDTTFNIGAGLNGNVRAVAVQNDGRILIGGEFTQYNGQGVLYLARLLSNGSLDASFNTTNSPNGPVYTLALSPDGKIMIGGEFTAVGSIPCDNLARLSADGTVDASFSLEYGANGPVVSLAVQNNGKVVLVGDFTRMGEMPRGGIARLNFAGSVDLSINFGSGPNDRILSVVLQSDEQILIAGRFTAFNGYPRQYLARLMGGSIQSAGIFEFSTAAYEAGEGASNLVVRVTRSGGAMGRAEMDVMTFDVTATDGLDYVGVGTNMHLVFQEGETIKSFLIAILDDPAVEADETFALVLTNLTSEFEAVLGARSGAVATILDDDCYVGFATDFYTVVENVIGGKALVTVTRFGSIHRAMSVDYATTVGTATEGIDYVSALGTVTFAKGETNKTFAVTILDDLDVEGSETIGLVLSNPVGAGITLATATLTLVDNDFNFPGTADSAFDPGVGANGFIRCLAVQSDSNVVVGGAFTMFGGTNRGGIARLFADGSLDQSFDPGTGANGLVSSVAVLPDGRVALAGAFTSFNDLPFSRVTRLLPNGSLDTELNSLPAFNAAINVLAAYPNGAVVLGGGFSAPLRSITQLRRDGSIDITFAPGGGANAPVYAILKQDDGRLLVGGAFTAVDGTPRLRLARVRADGLLDMSFKADVITSGTVYGLALQNDGRILVAGNFALTNSATRVNLARVLSDGSLDASFQVGAGANSTVYGVALQASGKIIVGGDFTEIGGVGRNRYARLLSTGEVDITFDPGDGADGTVYAVAVLPDRNILIGGDFTKVNNVARAGIARVSGEDHDLRFTEVTSTAVRTRLTLSVSPGITYVLEASTNLVDWTMISTNQAAGMSLDFIEPAAGEGARKFYRARQGP